MIKVSEFEWDMPEARLKHFRSPAPPEDRAIFLHDEVGSCFEGTLRQNCKRLQEEVIRLGTNHRLWYSSPPFGVEPFEGIAPSEPDQSLFFNTPFFYMPRMRYGWVSEWPDLEKTGLSSSEEMPTEEIEGFLSLFGEPAMGKSWKRNGLLNCFALAHYCCAGEAEEILEADAEEHWGKSLLERLNEAYGDELEPGEEEFLELAKLRKRYEFKDDGAVEDFLGENPFLFGLLLETHDKIREYFDLDTNTALRVIKEPDAKNGRRLFVFIHTTLRPREAIARLDELDRDWWLDALPAAQGKLTIDIYYS